MRSRPRIAFSKMAQVRAAARGSGARPRSSSKRAVVRGSRVREWYGPSGVQIGTYPTPVQHLAALSRPGTSLWVKRDDLTNPVYGGNKIRKLEKLLTEAKARG